MEFMLGKKMAIGTFTLLTQRLQKRKEKSFNLAYATLSAQLQILQKYFLF